jgi:hypothetical protein
MELERSDISDVMIRLGNLVMKARSMMHMEVMQIGAMYETHLPATWFGSLLRAAVCQKPEVDRRFLAKDTVPCIASQT